MAEGMLRLLPLERYGLVIRMPISNSALPFLSLRRRAWSRSSTFQVIFLFLSQPLLSANLLKNVWNLSFRFDLSFRFLLLCTSELFRKRCVNCVVLFVFVFVSPEVLDLHLLFSGCTRRFSLLYVFLFCLLIKFLIYQFYIVFFFDFAISLWSFLDFWCTWKLRPGTASLERYIASLSVPLHFELLFDIYAFLNK